MKVFFIMSILILNACSQGPERYQGYVEGELRFIASNFSGELMELNVRRGDNVNVGQPLYSLEMEPEQSQLIAAQHREEAAQSQVLQLQSQVDLAKLEYGRQTKLVSKNAASQEQVDITNDRYSQAQQELQASLDNVQVAKAQLAEASWAKTKKQVNAGVQALVFDTFYKPTEYVAAGSPVLALLAPEDIKFVFFVSEQELSQIKMGQRINVSCDGCHPLHGKVYYISRKPEFTQPIIYSEQTRSKLSFMIEAYPDVISDTELHPGQPITVTLEK